MLLRTELVKHLWSRNCDFYFCCVCVCCMCLCIFILLKCLHSFFVTPLLCPLSPFPLTPDITIYIKDFTRKLLSYTSRHELYLCLSLIRWVLPQRCRLVDKGGTTGVFYLFLPTTVVSPKQTNFVSSQETNLTSIHPGATVRFNFFHSPDAGRFCTESQPQTSTFPPATLLRAPTHRGHPSS